MPASARKENRHKTQSAGFYSWKKFKFKWGSPLSDSPPASGDQGRVPVTARPGVLSQRRRRVLVVMVAMLFLLGVDLLRTALWPPPDRAGPSKTSLSSSSPDDSSTT